MGWSIRRIATDVGATWMTVARRLDPEMCRKERERQVAYRTANKEKVDAIAADWKKRNAERRDAQVRKGNLRMQARTEAAENGEDVYAIYERWGVLSSHDVRNDK
jgi:hypothetical protein